MRASLLSLKQASIKTETEACYQVYIWWYVRTTAEICWIKSFPPSTDTWHFDWHAQTNTTPISRKREIKIVYHALRFLFRGGVVCEAATPSIFLLDMRVENSRGDHENSFGNHLTFSTKTRELKLQVAIAHWFMTFVNRKQNIWSAREFCAIATLLGSISSPHYR